MTVTDVFQDNAQKLAHNIEILSDHITSYAVDANAEWPYITLPNFEQRIAPIRKDSLVDFYGFLPIVETMQREQWEAYAVDQQGWIQESYSALDNFKEEESTIHGNYSISPFISISVNGQQITHNAPGPYAPIWQLSPPPPPSDTDLVNEDILASLRFGPLLGAMQQKQIQYAISDIMELDLYNYTQSTFDNGTSIEDMRQPRSAIFAPIYASYTHSTIQGFALGVFPWAKYFSDVLPEGVDGVDCVIKTSCDGHYQAHTFRIHGKHASYIGKGSLRESQFDGFEVKSDMEFFHSYSTTEGTKCNYTLSIYPSEEFRSSFESRRSAIFTAVIAAVFVLTGLVFFLYVYIIGHRQNKVMQIAMGTSAIVASLFPSTVRDRIIEDAEQEVQRRRSSVKELSERGSAHMSIVNRGRRRSSLHKIQEQRKQQQQEQEHRRPLCDLFPESTGKFYRLLLLYQLCLSIGIASQYSMLVT
jgi:hypothetical protein